MPDLKLFFERLTSVEKILKLHLQPHAPSELSKRLSAELDELKSASGNPPEIPIALIGPARVGKSTLINSLLGARILTEDDLRFCTAAITVLRYHDKSDYEASLQFSSAEEWALELETCREILSTTYDPEDSESSEERKYHETALRTVYRIETGEPIDLDRLTLPSETERLLTQGSLKFRSSDPKELAKQLKPYTTSDGNFWPVVNYVEISGPFPPLRKGLQLVDLPGLNDPNPARERITSEYIDKSPYIWLTFSAKAPLTKDLHKLLVERKLLRQFLFEGKVNSFAVIGTHSDNVNYDEETLEKYGLSYHAPRALLIARRNERLKADVLEALRTIVDELVEQSGDNGSVRAEYREKITRVPVFLVASKEYQRHKGLVRGGDPPFLSQEQSQIPALLAHLETTAKDRDGEAHLRSLNEKLNLVLDEMHQFFRRQRDDFRSFRPPSKDRRQAVLNATQPALATLATRLAEAKSEALVELVADKKAFTSKLEFATSRAQRDLEMTIAVWRGINHMSLKAVVVRNGRFTSPASGRRFDLAEDLARPILDSIPFAWDHFFGTEFKQILTVYHKRLESNAERLLSDLQIALLRGDTILRQLESQVGEDLTSTKRSLEFRVGETLKRIESHIQETRQDLYKSISSTAGQRMQPAFEIAKEEKGRGMKARMLEALDSHARSIANDLYKTIERDLVEGLEGMEHEFGSQIDQLKRYLVEEGRRVIDNVAGTPGSPIESETALKQVDVAIEAIAGLVRSKAGVAVR
jgi:GTPase SAR1 family protein